MDILQQQGAAFLGSRLRRLGEQMQASAAKLIADAGLPMQPSHIPVLAALEVRALTVGQLVQAVGVSQPGITRAVGQLVELGLAQSQQAGEDQRQRTISLTPTGLNALKRAQLHVIPTADAAVRALLGDRTNAFLQQIGDVEAALAETPLHVVAARTGPALTIHDYRDELAPHFRDINAEWIGSMFRLEPTDEEVLANPRARIVDPGGVILFVEARGLGIVGTCALQKSKGSGYELTKMGVRETARGLKAGEFLLAAAIERAKAIGADPLYLLTNSKCAAAIHLYEKLGFRHDAGIMADYGARYERCDVAMRYQP